MESVPLKRAKVYTIYRGLLTGETGPGVLVLGELAGQLCSRSDPELAVDPAQVRLDGAHAQEQRVCDLAVRQSAADQVGDPLFGRCQVDRAGRPSSDPGGLGGRLVGPQGRTEALEDLQRPIERVPRQSPLLHAAERLALREERSTQLEGLVEQRVGLERA